MRTGSWSIGWAGAVVAAATRTPQPPARARLWLLTRVLSAAIVVGILTTTVLAPMLVAAVAPSEEPVPLADAAPGTPTGSGVPRRDILLAIYAGAPLFHRSDLHMTRPDGTDLTLRGLGWDGDALYFPIDGGIRSVEWWRSFGVMIDFMHNKAIARLGRGAHGRKISSPVIDTVEAEGTLAGKPVTSQVALTDIFQRLEFTHGHNTLLFTGLWRPGVLWRGIRPYLGVGAGFAIPHVEVWFPGGKRGDRTSEYQYAGPAAQLLAGVELRAGRFSYFLEYKLTWASISGQLTGDESWMNFFMPGDLSRQFGRWWRGEEPSLGRIETTLTAHQIVAGAGWWWQPRTLTARGR